MPTHHVVRTSADEDRVNATIKENEEKGAGLIQVLPIPVGGDVSEVMLVFRVPDADAPRAAGFRAAAEASH